MYIAAQPMPDTAFCASLRSRMRFQFVTFFYRMHDICLRQLGILNCSRTFSPAIYESRIAAWRNVARL